MSSQNVCNVELDSRSGNGCGKWSRAGAFAVALVVSAPMLSASSAQAEEPRVAKADAGQFVYRPPDLGMPKVRVGGASRGVGQSMPTVQVLAPEHTGRTLVAQPALYWYLSGDVDARFEFTLLDQNSIDPVAELTLEPQPRAGINRIDLAHVGVELRAGVEYQWSVAAVLDEAQRSKDVVAIGRIQREDGAVAGADNADPTLVAELAGAGIWYDALSALNAHIDLNPGDVALVESREKLLRQVGLSLSAAK